MHVKYLIAPLAVAAGLFIPLAAQLSGQVASENQIVLNIEPSREHPRNSEGSFATLASGRIVFYYAQFYGGDYDFSAARLVQIHSDDQGLTWSRPRVFLERGDNLNVTQISLLRLESGQ